MIWSSLLIVGCEYVIFAHGSVETGMYPPENNFSEAGSNCDVLTWLVLPPTVANGAFSVVAVDPVQPALVSVLKSPASAAAVTGFAGRLVACALRRVPW